MKDYCSKAKLWWALFRANKTLHVFLLALSVAGIWIHKNASQHSKTLVVPPTTQKMLMHTRDLLPQTQTLLDSLTSNVLVQNWDSIWGKREIMPVENTLEDQSNSVRHCSILDSISPANE